MDTKATDKPGTKPVGGGISAVVQAIEKAENVLVALSKNPTVDEMTAALALDLVLDKTKRHSTAIFSGVIPDALKFLDAEKNFSSDTDSLQDFIIALNKEKADHLRYKIEGDYVKVFITPYRQAITEKDLEFSHGDYNIDLVIALNVATEGDLDGALAGHGRILHDAAVVELTTGVGGNLGGVVWMDKLASSVCEMVGILANRLKGSGESLVDPAIATALLTGIVAETDRFSNEKTNPDTMLLAAKLMEAGADQKLIAANVTGDLKIVGGAASGGVRREEDSISIRHEEEKTVETQNDAAGKVDLDIEGGDSGQELEKIIETKQTPSGPILDELKQAVEEIGEEGEKGEPLEVSYDMPRVEEKTEEVKKDEDDLGGDELPKMPDLQSMPTPPPATDEDELDRVATESGLDFEPITMPNGTVLPPPPPPPIPDFADLGDLGKAGEEAELPKIGGAPKKVEPLGASYAPVGSSGGARELDLEPAKEMPVPSGVGEPGLPPVMMDGGLPPVSSAHGAPALDVPDLSSLSSDEGGAEQFRIPT
jgi:hypothetical protein